MTIAACYVSPEGVVFGADSTASVLFSGSGQTDGYHYFNHNQKIFEVGEDSSFGLVTWGMAGLPGFSHRTLVGRLADEMKAKKAPSDLLEVAKRWAALFWKEYAASLKPQLDRTSLLRAKGPYDPAANPPVPNSRTKPEEDEFVQLERNLVVGFCIGGVCLPSRQPAAYEVIFQPSLSAAPNPREIKGWSFWGAPNMIERLIFGRDANLKAEIIKGGKWSGTTQELEAVLNKFSLAESVLPIRDAIDFVYSCIYSTIKAMKFSSLPQICGGPIELSVVTSDRKFRWVMHKPWDAAIFNGE